MGLEPQKYRKKPVVIEAMYYDGSEESRDAVVAWMNEGGEPATWYPRHGWGKFDCYVIEIPTIEGTHEVTPKYFIIKGVEDEFYGCEEQIFHKTYELA